MKSLCLKWLAFTLAAVALAWGCWLRLGTGTSEAQWLAAMAAGRHEEALRLAREKATTPAWNARAAESAFRLRELDSARHFLAQGGTGPETDWLRAIDGAWRWDWKTVDPLLAEPLSSELTVRRAALLVPVYHGAYDPNRGVEAARAWVAGEPANPAAWSALASQLDRLNLFEEVAESHRQRLRIEPGSPDSLRALTSFHIQRRQFEEAVPYLDQLEAREPGDPQLTVWRAKCLDGLGNTAQARSLLDRLLAVLPGHDEAAKERAMEAMADNVPDLAVKLLAPISDRYRFDPEVWTLLERAQILTGDLARSKTSRKAHDAAVADQRALAQLARKVVAEPRVARWRAETAEILYRQNVRIEATRWASGALLVDPGNALARSLLEAHDPAVLGAISADNR